MSKTPVSISSRKFHSIARPDRSLDKPHILDEGHLGSSQLKPSVSTLLEASHTNQSLKYMSPLTPQEMRNHPAHTVRIHAGQHSNIPSLLHVYMLESTQLNQSLTHMMIPSSHELRDLPEHTVRNQAGHNSSFILMIPVYLSQSTQLNQSSPHMMISSHYELRDLPATMLPTTEVRTLSGHMGCPHMPPIHHEGCSLTSYHHTDHIPASTFMKFWSQTNTNCTASLAMFQQYYFALVCTSSSTRSCYSVYH